MTEVLPLGLGFHQEEVRTYPESHFDTNWSFFSSKTIIYMLTACSRLPFSCQLVPRWVLKFSWVTSALSSDSRLTNQSGVLLRLGLLGTEMQAGLTGQLRCSNQAWRMTNTSFLPPQEGHSPTAARGGDWQPSAQGVCGTQENRRGMARWGGCSSARSGDVSHEKLIFRRLFTTWCLAQQKRKKKDSIA